MNQRAEMGPGPYGIALIRIVVGFVFLMHGQQKLFEMGVGNVEGWFGSGFRPRPWPHWW